jgi:hypothetical protein
MGGIVEELSWCAKLWIRLPWSCLRECSVRLTQRLASAHPLGRDQIWLKRKLVATKIGIRTQDFFCAVPQFRSTLPQARIGLGTGRSPSSSDCSLSAQTLLSRSQSRSSTLSSKPIMHLLNRPSCRGPLVNFGRRYSGYSVPGT